MLTVVVGGGGGVFFVVSVYVDWLCFFDYWAYIILSSRALVLEL